LSIDSFEEMVDKSVEDSKLRKAVDARKLKESVKKWK
jgi:hypothetical protein